VGITHFDEARTAEYALGHLTSRWTLLGESAGSIDVGVRRIEVPAGHWSTPAHEHGAGEEIFYVLAGRGLSWQRGKASEIRAGDCIVYHPRRGAHSLHATEPLDVLAFGPRIPVETAGFPRLDLSMAGGRAFDSVPSVLMKAPIQFVREAAIGPPELPEHPDPRPKTVANLADVEGITVTRTRVERTRRDLGRAAGSVTTGLKHVEVAAGKDATAMHCHSAEEEIFVILEGTGTLRLGAEAEGDGVEDTPVRAGHVIARPAGTGISHLFVAGEQGLTFLAYGPREPSDICYYPRSRKVAFRGVNLLGRIERLDYWDGED
jgi:uncharacterized cupin superfamily protein